MVAEVRGGTGILAACIRTVMSLTFPPALPFDPKPFHGMFICGTGLSESQRVRELSRLPQSMLARAFEFFCAPKPFDMLSARVLPAMALLHSFRLC